MNGFAVFIMFAAWACLFFAPKGMASRMIQLLVFGLLGILFTLAGGFSYWWDSGMRPGQKSSVLLVCGLLTLLSQLGTILYAVLVNEGGVDLPEKPRRYRR